MDNLLESLTSTFWWISVLVTGVITSLIAAYLKPKVDSLLGRWSAKRVAANSKRQLEFIDHVKRVSSNPHEQIMLLLEILRRLVIGIIFLILGSYFGPLLVMVGLGPLRAFIPVMGFFMAIVLLTGLRELVSTAHDFAVLSQARQTPQEAKQPEGAENGSPTTPRTLP